MKLRNLIILALVVASSFGFRGCGDKNDGVYTGTWSRKNSARTAKQVQVYSENKINTSLFPSIDQGIDRLAETAILEGYQPMAHPEFVVALFPRSPKCISPGFLIRADGSTWDGTEYDKDPKQGKVLLCAAGLHPGMNVMIVADDLSHMANIVQFEGEHITLLHRDVDRWIATSGIHAHPIFRQSAAFVSTEYKVIILELEEDIKADGLTVRKGQKICVLVVK